MMLRPITNVSQVWAVANYLSQYKERTPIHVFCNAYMYQGLEPMDDSYVKRTNHRFPIVLRNKAKNATRIHKHLLWQAQNNTGRHEVRWGDRRMTVMVRMLGGNNGPHDTRFQQTIIKTERFAGRGKGKEWREVTKQEWVKI